MPVMLIKPMFTIDDLGSFIYYASFYPHLAFLDDGSNALVLVRSNNEELVNQYANLSPIYRDVVIDVNAGS